MAVVVVAFSSRARTFGECSTIHLPLQGEFSSSTLIPLFRPESVHSGPASWDDCDRVFPDEWIHIPFWLWCANTHSMLTVMCENSFHADSDVWIHMPFILTVVCGYTFHVDSRVWTAVGNYTFRFVCLLNMRIPLVRIVVRENPVRFKVIWFSSTSCYLRCYLNFRRDVLLL